MNVAIILSGGVGSRMGADIPKQYIMVGERPIASYCIETFAKRKDIDAIVIVVANEWRDFVLEYTKDIEQPVWVASPGETRQHSIYNGLKECKNHGVDDDSIVIIHDAARPLVTDAIIDECLDGCKTHDGAMPVISIKDTVYQSTDGVEIKNLLDRKTLFAGQSPEGFVFGKYLKIHDESNYEDICKITGSTEIAYKHGLNVKMIKGDPMNIKITTQEDLYSFKVIIKSWSTEL